MNFKFLPNLITLFNLFLGCIVALLLIENNLEVKYVFIITIICLILDYLDGYTARKLNVKSDIILRTKLNKNLSNNPQLLELNLQGLGLLPN